MCLFLILYGSGMGIKSMKPLYEHAIGFNETYKHMHLMFNFNFNFSLTITVTI